MRHRFRHGPRRIFPERPDTPPFRPVGFAVFGLESGHESQWNGKRESTPYRRRRRVRMRLALAIDRGEPFVVEGARPCACHVSASGRS